MKILLIGATGLLGTAVMKELKEGHEIIKATEIYLIYHYKIYQKRLI
ncbi:hypothetical protein [Salinicoccus albus]|nr:hypothetical protein [Salinicoccus albus]